MNSFCRIYFLFPWLLTKIDIKTGYSIQKYLDTGAEVTNRWCWSDNHMLPPTDGCSKNIQRSHSYLHKLNHEQKYLLTCKKTIDKVIVWYKTQWMSVVIMTRNFCNPNMILSWLNYTWGLFHKQWLTKIMAWVRNCIHRFSVGCYF